MLLPAIGTQEQPIRDSDVSTNEPSRYAHAVAAFKLLTPSRATHSAANTSARLYGPGELQCVLQQLKAHTGTLMSTGTRANNCN
jgi:hypothetical protein